jgi:NADH-quinone oxidoreductase subunit J
MSATQIIFLLTALVTLVSATLVVTTRKMLHAALWLVLSLFGVAILYVLLEAGFFAVVQVLVYIGAISILIIFAVMMTRRVMQDTGPQVTRHWWIAAVAALFVLGGLLAMYTRWNGFTAALPDYSAAAQAQSIANLGVALTSPNGFVLPFEAASVLLLAALIGAIYIAWEKRS